MAKEDNLNPEAMKILVYGAGVIGTLYASRLLEAGHQVTVLARGSRLAEVQDHGLIIQDVVSGDRSTARASTVESLCAEDSYDMALISVRRDQLSGIMPHLAANKNVPTVFFMLNNPLGSAQLANALGSNRVLLGFPGAGGAIQDHVVRYVMIPQQPTTVGEAVGMHTARPRAWAEILRGAGFRTRVDSDMEGWLTTHAFFVTSVGGAIYLAGGNCEELSRNPKLLELMVRGTREGFRTVRTLGRSVHPLGLSVLFSRLPTSVAVYYWRRFFSNRMAEYVFGQHVRSAALEMQTLAAECRVLLAQSRIFAPALEQLYQAIDDYAAEHGGGLPAR